MTPRSRRWRLLAGGLVAAIAFTASTASAGETPTVWKRARVATVARESDALLAVDHEIAQEKKTHELEVSLELPPDVARMHRLRSLQALDDAGARRSRDPIVLAAVGSLLHDLDFHEEAARILRFVAKSDTLARVRGDAYADLATTLARLGKLDEEIASYESALAFEPHGISRSTLLANQAEAYMVKGDVTRAIEGYRASIGSFSSAELPLAATTLWSLGVALDRSGDLEGALASIARARTYDPIDRGLQPPNWFFVPDYDSHWYAALGELLVGRNAKDPWVRKSAYAEAIGDFGEYIDKAGDHDQYVLIAKARLAMIRKEAAAFDKKVGKLPQPIANDARPSAIRRLQDPH